MANNPSNHEEELGTYANFEATDLVTHSDGSLELGCEVVDTDFRSPEALVGTMRDSGIDIRLGTRPQQPNQSTSGRKSFGLSEAAKRNWDNIDFGHGNPKNN